MNKNRPYSGFHIAEGRILKNVASYWSAKWYKIVSDFEMNWASSALMSGKQQNIFVASCSSGDSYAGEDHGLNFCQKINK